MHCAAPGCYTGDFITRAVFGHVANRFLIEVTGSVEIDRDFEQILPNDDVTIEHIVHFVNHSLDHTRFVERRRHVGEDQCLDPRAFSDLGDIKVAAIGLPKRLIWLGPHHEVAHVNEDVTVLRNCNHVIAHTAIVAGIDDDAIFGFEAICKTLEIRLKMYGLSHLS